VTATSTARPPVQKRWLGARRLWVVAAVLFLGTVSAAAWFQSKGRAPAFYDVEVVATHPHSLEAFCQGLEFSDGKLFEGTGLYGESKLRRLDLTSGTVEQEISLPPDLFGEGITLWNGQVVQLTWTSRVGLVYDKASFAKTGQFRYTGEGWGLTHDDKNLIMSDGTATLRFLDPKTFKVVRKLRVVDRGRAVDQLNELEFVEGEIYANVWGKSYIARISPKTGAVVGWIDASKLSHREKAGNNSVLNGIAYEPTTKKLYLTGKQWSDLFEVRLVPR
jgi:glutaminyl-peptide cyclotransferase